MSTKQQLKKVVGAYKKAVEQIRETVNTEADKVRQTRPEQTAQSSRQD